MFSFQAPSIKITHPQEGEIIASPELEIETEVSSELEVSQVDFFLDGESIGSQKSSPFKIKFNLPESKNGQEGLIIARVFDEDGEKGEDEVRVTFQF